MAQFSSLKSGVNLLPVDTSKPQPMKKAVRYGLQAARYTGVGLAILTVLLAGYQYYLNAKLRATVSMIEQNLSTIQQKQTFETDFTSLQGYVQTVAGTHAALIPHAGIFNDLEEITPQSVTLTAFTLTDEGLRLTGSTVFYSAVNDYVEELKASQLFSAVQIISISRPTTDAAAPVEFTLDLTIN